MLNGLVCIKIGDSKRDEWLVGTILVVVGEMWVSSLLNDQA